MPTIYRLARPGGEYNTLYKLMEREGLARSKLGWPTVVAERDGEIIGFLSTHTDGDLILAGPLVIRGGRNPFTFVRLAEAYENMLRLASIRLYFFNVEKSNSAQVERVKALGFPICGESETHIMFKRTL